MKKILVFVSALVLAGICSAADLVDINSASLEQLDTLTGIGPVYAQRIIDSRPFFSIDDLIRVSGIGKKTLAKIKKQGIAYVACTQAILNEAPNPNPPDSGQIQRSASSTVSTAIVQETQPLNSSIASSEKAMPQISYPADVFINEIMPNPKGSDETEEWIELYNSNNFGVDLSGWQIQDTNGTSGNFTIPQNTKIQTKGFLVFKRTETKITLNNEADGLNLLTPDQKIIDSMSFFSAPLNQSYNKSDSGWVWSADFTPGAINVATTPVQAKKVLPKEKKSANNISEAGLASLNPDRNDAFNGISPWILFFTALATAIVSGAIVLFVKFRFKNNKNLKI